MFRGDYGGRVLSRLYDETGVIGRVRGFQLGAGTVSNSDLEQTFGFTSVGRFETIASSRSGDSGTLRRFRYGYLANSALLETLAIDQGAGPGGHPFSITRAYDPQRDVLTGLDSKWSGTVKTGYVYTNDQRGQRSKVVQSGDAFADYGDVTSQEFIYNGRGELTNAIGYMGSDITISNKQMGGRRHEYGYDTAGNRQWSNRTGVTALRDDYTVNALNQYTARENNTVPLSGTAEPDTGGAGGVAVSVQGGTLAPVAAGRQGRYWNDDITVNNNYGTTPTAPHATIKNPWRGPLTIFTAKRGTGGSPDLYRVDSRMAEIGAMMQRFTYDNDGNLLSDGIADYQWDAENRLVRMETTTMARAWGFPHRLLEFRYDYMGRRVQKRVVDVTLSQEISCRRFLYDGWNLIAEYAAPGAAVCGALLRSYTWGLDIVNTMANAGGVGALLQIADHPTNKTYLPTYDGNGNIAALINAGTPGTPGTGPLAAVYEYSPYGEPLRSQILDSTVADNPFRFSTKWTDLETGLVYYGRRYYSSSQGRFLGRDSIEEEGGLNLYGFCNNNAINYWDVLGNAISVTATDYGTFMAQSTDSWGNYGEWNFSSELDALNWATAWESHDMSVVGDRNVTDVYLFPGTPIDSKSSNYDDRFALAWQNTRSQGYSPDDGSFEIYLQQNYDNFYGSQENNGGGSSGFSARSFLDAMFGSAYRSASEPAGVGGSASTSFGGVGWMSFSLTFAAQKLATRPTVTIYVMSGNNHGGDYYTALSALSFANLNLYDPNHRYKVVPVGTLDAAPKPGADNYFVTHQYIEPTSGAAKIASRVFGSVMGLTGIGMRYVGEVGVPLALNGTGIMSTAAFDAYYGSDHTFYCGKNGGSFIVPTDVSIGVGSRYMTQAQMRRYIDSLYVSLP